VPIIPVPPLIIPAVKIASKIPPLPPIKKKFITREDLATVFQRGGRGLTRKSAVAALKALGFGKTAAYEALSAIWHGGSTPATVRVGQGIIKDRIATHRNDPEVQAYANLGLTQRSQAEPSRLCLMN
jgi:hypothetical protein